jgi:hypothetical protein
VQRAQVPVDAMSALVVMESSLTSPDRLRYQTDISVNQPSVMKLVTTLRARSTCWAPTTPGTQF